MREAIGDVLPLGVGVALSPIPIIAVTLMLVSRRARANGPLFVLGWLLGLAVVGVGRPTPTTTVSQPRGPASSSWSSG